MGFAITGIGVLSPFGVGNARLIDGLLRVAAPPPRSDAMRDAFPPGGLQRVGDRCVDAALADEATRTLSKEVKMLLGAARLAIADAGLGLGCQRDEEVGVAVSTTCSGLQAYTDLYQAGTTAQPGAVDPSRGPQTGFNAPAAYVSIRLGLRGPNVTMISGAVGGFDALAYALQTLSTGRATVMLVGGVDALPGGASTGVPTSCAGDGERRARPFDRYRDGAVAGEAGVVIILEDASHALRRGSRLYAEVAAVAHAFSCHHDLAEACERSLAGALDASATDPGEIVAAFAGANGSVAGDAAEAGALYKLLRARVPVCAVKGAISECAGASALVQLATAILSADRAVMPPTAGFRVQDPELPPLRLLTSRSPLSHGRLLVHTWDDSCCSASTVIRTPPLLQSSVRRQGLQ